MQEVAESNRKMIKGGHKGRLISRGMLAACYAAYIVTACMGMTVGRNGNESELYSNGTPVDVQAESVTTLTCFCGRISVTVWCFFLSS